MPSASIINECRASSLGVFFARRNDAKENVNPRALAREDKRLIMIKIVCCCGAASSSSDPKALLIVMNEFTLCVAHIVFGYICRVYIYIVYNVCSHMAADDDG